MFQTFTSRRYWNKLLSKKLKPESPSSLTPNICSLSSKRLMKRLISRSWGNSSNLGSDDWKRNPKCRPLWFSPPSFRSWDPCTKETISPLSYPLISRDAERRVCSTSFRSSPRINMRWKATWERLPISSTSTSNLIKLIYRTSRIMWISKRFRNLCTRLLPGRGNQLLEYNSNMIQLPREPDVISRGKARSKISTSIKKWKRKIMIDLDAPTWLVMLTR